MRRLHTLRRARQHSLVISSVSGARDALIQLNQGGATLIKTFDRGKPTLAIRSERENYEARISADLHHMFANFFERHGHHDALFDDSQTASI